MVIRGKAFWAKVLGQPGWGYKKQHKEWSTDVAITPKDKERLLAEGMGKQYIKNKDDERGDFLTFRRRELKRDGTPGKPISVFDKRGQPWPQETLIGNGSAVNIKIALNGVDGQKELKPGLIKMQVVELVEFEGRDDDEDFPVYDDDGNEEKWDED